MKLSMSRSSLLHLVLVLFAIFGLVVAVAHAPTAAAATAIDVCVGKRVGTAVTFKNAQGDSVTAVCILSAMPSTDILAMANGKSAATSVGAEER